MELLECWKDVVLEPDLAGCTLRTAWQPFVSTAQASGEREGDLMHPPGKSNERSSRKWEICLTSARIPIAAVTQRELWQYLYI